MSDLPAIRSSERTVISSSMVATGTLDVIRSNYTNPLALNANSRDDINCWNPDLTVEFVNSIVVVEVEIGTLRLGANFSG